MKKSELKQLIKEVISEIKLNERAGIWKDAWDRDDTILTLYNAKFGTRGLGITTKELAEDIIGSLRASLYQQTANINFLLTGEGLEDYSKMQEQIVREYKNKSANELRQICLSIIAKRGDSIKKQRQQKFQSIQDKKALESEFAKRGFDPSKMKSMGVRTENIEPVKESTNLKTKSILSSIEIINTKTVELIDFLNTLKNEKEIN